MNIMKHAHILSEFAKQAISCSLQIAQFLRLDRHQQNQLSLRSTESIKGKLLSSADNPKHNKKYSHRLSLQQLHILTENHSTTLNRLSASKKIHCLRQNNTLLFCTGFFYATNHRATPTTCHTGIVRHQTAL